MNVILEKYPYRYIEMDNLLENGHPDYRIQKFHDWTQRYRDMYLLDNSVQLDYVINWIMLLKTLNIQNGQTPIQRSLHTQKMIVKKPWGTYEVILDEPNYKVKRIVVHPYERFSLQYHKHREEHWVVVEGDGIVQLYR